MYSEFSRVSDHTSHRSKTGRLGKTLSKQTQSTDHQLFGYGWSTKYHEKKVQQYRDLRKRAPHLSPPIINTILQLTPDTLRLFRKITLMSMNITLIEKKNWNVALNLLIQHVEHTFTWSSRNVKQYELLLHNIMYFSSIKINYTFFYLATEILDLSQLSNIYLLCPRIMLFPLSRDDFRRTQGGRCNTTGDTWSWGGPHIHGVALVY